MLQNKKVLQNKSLPKVNTFLLYLQRRDPNFLLKNILQSTCKNLLIQSRSTGKGTGKITTFAGIVKVDWDEGGSAAAVSGAAFDGGFGSVQVHLGEG